MLLGIILFGSKQLNFIAAIAVVASLVALTAKVILLPAASTRRPLLGVLISWALINAVPLVVDPSQKEYSKIYMILLPISWVLYFFAVRSLYQQVFTRYPGISYAGKWALNIAAGIAVALLVGSSLFTESPFMASRGLTAVMLMDRCVVGGMSVLLIMLVLVIWRYPITIQRNIAVHCMLFSAIFLLTALTNVAYQWAGFKHGGLINLVGSAASVTLCILWTVRLNALGETLAVKIRKPVNAALESHLLNQLDTLNGILLRAVRK